ncbi:ABC transporter ATP-binding protein [Frankia sp. AiPs1]|uniref:ABC transporter ATP-binding protein n=1 Tax=Frankia sp. AiPs1 TaxID=573493 RepID=UPI0020437CA4|nr:ABC transporter ATP-binding protein [Frankia sp. AiPs1]MCM3920452.1 ABC transporter ATP-binding protein [Frankia sp. AiPs1]
MPTVELRGVEKNFGTVKALDAIDLSIADGEQVAILGPSGSGKSTLLRVIAGLETHDSGTLTVDGVDQRAVPAHRRDMAIVFQHFALYPHLSSLGNITLGLRHGLKLSKQEARARAHDVATRMQVEHLLDRKPREMSGGQRQRIALARALARRSGIVLLDEPLSGLDAQLHAALRVEIAELLRSVHATGVNVTHDQVDAMAMADRVAIVNHGKVEQLGTPDELYAVPATVFVASFVGSPPMNLAPVGEDGSSVFGARRLRVDGPVILGVRPERLRFTAGDVDLDWHARGRVALIEPNGADRVVHVELDTPGPRRTFAVRCRSGEQPPLHAAVDLSCSPDDVHVFAGEQGRRRGTVAELGGEPAMAGAQ